MGKCRDSAQLNTGIPRGKVTESGGLKWTQVEGNVFCGVQVPALEQN